MEKLHGECILKTLTMLQNARPKLGEELKERKLIDMVGILQIRSCSKAERIREILGVFWMALLGELPQKNHYLEYLAEELSTYVNPLPIHLEGLLGHWHNQKRANTKCAPLSKAKAPMMCFTLVLISKENDLSSSPWKITTHFLGFMSPYTSSILFPVGICAGGVGWGNSIDDRLASVDYLSNDILSCDYPLLNWTTHHCKRLSHDTWKKAFTPCIWSANALEQSKTPIATGVFLRVNLGDVVRVFMETQSDISLETVAPDYPLLSSLDENGVSLANLDEQSKPAKLWIGQLPLLAWPSDSPCKQGGDLKKEKEDEHKVQSCFVELGWSRLLSLCLARVQFQRKILALFRKSNAVAHLGSIPSFDYGIPMTMQKVIFKVTILALLRWDYLHAKEHGGEDILWKHFLEGEHAIIKHWCLIQKMADEQKSCLADKTTSTSDQPNNLKMRSLFDNDDIRNDCDSKEYEHTKKELLAILSVTLVNLKMEKMFEFSETCDNNNNGTNQYGDSSSDGNYTNPTRKHVLEDALMHIHLEALNNYKNGMVEICKTLGWKSQDGDSNWTKPLEVLGKNLARVLLP